jgi:hypothetical protein
VTPLNVDIATADPDASILQRLEAVAAKHLGRDCRGHEGGEKQDRCVVKLRLIVFIATGEKYDCRERKSCQDASKRPERACGGNDVEAVTVSTMEFFWAVRHRVRDVCR